MVYASPQHYTKIAFVRLDLKILSQTVRGENLTVATINTR